MATTSRRVVTVLFADLVGFTTLSESLDPEDLAILQAAYFERAEEIVHQHGGTVEKYIGDAVVAGFGVVRADGDEPERAVRAATQLVAGVGEVGRRLGLPIEALRVRVGVTTGDMHVNVADDGSWRLTGDSMNMASRLQGIANPGEIVIGAGTALGVEHAFRLAILGPQEVKGKTETVDAWRVLGATTSAVLPLVAGPLVGRTTLLTALEASLHSVDSPSALVVVAPPGVGKSRLVAALADRARLSGHAVATATVSASAGTAYEAVAQLVRAKLGGQAADPALLLDRLARHGLGGPRAALAVEHITALLTGARLESPASGEMERLERFRSWIAVLDADESPTRALWVVEDIQLATPDLMAFLRYAIDTGDPRERLVVLTSRPALPATEGLPGARVVHLEPLDRDDIAELMTALLGPDVLPHSLVSGIAAAADGNPLFVEELLRSWAQAGVLHRDGERWTIDPMHRELGLPTTIHGLYLSQLDDLDGQARDVVTRGSVPGRTFPEPALPALGAPYGEAVERLTEHGLLLGPHPAFGELPAYTYRHGVLRDVAYAALSRRDRVLLHLRFAQWAERTTELVASDDLAALHLTAALEAWPALLDELDGRTRASVEIDAADRLELTAARLIAAEPETAAHRLSQAVAWTPAPALGDRRRRQLLQAEGLRRSGRFEDAMRAYLSAEGAESRADLSSLAAAALGYEDALYASRLPRTVWGEAGLDFLRAALAASPPDSSTRVRLLAALGRALVYGGHADEGATACTEAVQLARRCSDDAALAYALLAIRATQQSPATLPARLAASRDIVDAARRARDAESEFEGLRLRFVDLLQAEDQGASTVRAEAEALAHRLRQPMFLWYPPMWAAMDALRVGDPAAPSLIERFAAEGTRWHYRDAALVHTTQAMHLNLVRGTPQASLAAVSALQAEEPMRWAPSLALVLARSGDLRAARDMFEVHAASGFATLEPDLSWSYNAALSVWTAAALGHAEAAEILFELLAPWVGQTIVLGSGALCLGSAAHFAGVAALTAGRPADAAPLLARAAADNEAAGSVVAADESRRELARLLDRGRRGTGEEMGRVVVR